MSKVPPSVGCIGAGYVGGSFATGFAHYTNVKIYDINPMLKTDEYEDVIKQDVIVVALPSPMRKDGSVDISIIDNALIILNEALDDHHIGNPKPVVLKSTCPPQALVDWQDQLRKITLIFNIEFLTERTARLDFQQSNRIILGVPNGSKPENHELELKKVERLFEIRFPQVPIYWVSYAEASLIKYATNSFFCVKLSFCNEFAQICEAYSLDYNAVMGKVLLDQRIGRSHWMVPGHDNHKGWGGSCFYKDLQGYMHIAKDANVDPKLAKAAWDKNEEVRDVWAELESMKGRAFSDEFDRSKK